MRNKKRKFLIFLPCPVFCVFSVYPLSLPSLFSSSFSCPIFLCSSVIVFLSSSLSQCLLSWFSPCISLGFPPSLYVFLSIFSLYSCLLSFPVFLCLPHSLPSLLSFTCPVFVFLLPCTPVTCHS